LPQPAETEFVKQAKQTYAAVIVLQLAVMGFVNQIVERLLLIALLIVPQLVEMVFANQEKIVKTVVSIVQTQLAETEFVSLLVGKIHQIVRSIALQLVEMEFVKAERIPQIAA
jgi:hypothetical protein